MQRTRRLTATICSFLVLVGTIASVSAADLDESRGTALSQSPLVKDNNSKLSFKSARFCTSCHQKQFS